MLVCHTSYKPAVETSSPKPVVAFFHHSAIRTSTNPQVRNNLDETWQGVFSSVMDDWDHGIPDAVTFRIDTTSDPDCAPVPGVLVVCNDDDGATDWCGLHELRTEEGRILAAVVRLNDRRLDGAAAALRRHVLCREVGRGLGLGRAEDDAWTAHSSGCMQRTTLSKGAAARPGPRDFQRLERMYGHVDGARPPPGEVREPPLRRSRPHVGIRSGDSVDDRGQAMRARNDKRRP